MYVTCERRPERKWRHGQRLVFWLVESKRDGAAARTHKLAYLGSIYERESAYGADHAHTRKWFWIRARERLERHGVYSDRLVGLLERWVAPISDVEAQTLASRAVGLEQILAQLSRRG